MGDVDGDGDFDIVFGNNHVPNTVWLNDGRGQFSDSGQRLGFSTSWAMAFGDTFGIALGDLDGDGDLDIFDSNGHFGRGGPNLVWLNDGNGGYSDSGQRLGDGVSRAVDLGDLDGDGDLDVLVANRDHASTVWINDGGATFLHSGQWLGVGWHDVAAIEDVDGDGDLDAYFGRDDVWLNDGSGHFVQGPRGRERRLELGRLISVALADLDGDGDLDGLVGTTGANVLWRNESTVGDVDGDQRFDQFDIAQVLERGKFLSGQPASWTDGDWNGDGHFDQLDIVAALQSGNYLHGWQAAQAIGSRAKTANAETEPRHEVVDRLMAEFRRLGQLIERVEPCSLHALRVDSESWCLLRNVRCCCPSRRKPRCGRSTAVAITSKIPIGVPRFLRFGESRRRTTRTVIHRRRARIGPTRG